MDCLFCKMARGEIRPETIYEDADFLAFLDIKPVNPGHTLLIPKQHYENLLEIPDDTLAKIAPLIKKLAIAVKEGVNADGINIGMNNGRAAGQEVFHSHIHIMPRFDSDTYEMWHGKPYDSDTEIKEFSKKIKSSL